MRNYLKERAREVDQALGKYLPGARVRPTTIHTAMRYSIFAGGKRLRPILSLAAAEACGGRRGDAMPSACAVECVHTYSLIHDDLPCMDDDDLRRGLPTAHKKFGEGIAVLAGDALLTLAFEILAGTPCSMRHPLSAFMKELAVAAGSRQLIAGQVADLEAEGKKIDRRQLRFIHDGKTAAMISASLKLGAMSTNASPAKVAALGDFGRSVGLAFQILDDILDVTASSEDLGKSAGKDQRDGKSTYPAIIGLEASRREARRLTDAATTSLRPFGKSAEPLREIAAYLLDRKF